MERFALKPSEAFAVLRRVSQDPNTRLHEVATELVTSRQTPAPAARAAGRGRP
jgi:AmiR/NasT family two-component response regulator